MPACEKCWSDAAYGEYTALVEKRSAEGHTCTPEQQAGPDAGLCPRCHRKTLHQHVPDHCMNCDATQTP